MIAAINNKVMVHAHRIKAVHAINLKEETTAGQFNKTDRYMLQVDYEGEASLIFSGTGAEISPLSEAFKQAKAEQAKTA